jgi:hypothetical protein
MMRVHSLFCFLMFFTCVSYGQEPTDPKATEDWSRPPL